MLTPAQFYGRHLPITQDDIIAAGKLLGVKPGTVAAVVSVEAGGEPFLSDGRPKTLYEAHKFGQYTNNVFRNHRDTKGKLLSSPKWDKTLYGAAGAWQYKRIEMAMALNNSAALRATSWGAFQIMGANSGMVGYSNVDDFVLAMADGGGKQVEAFCKFIISAGLRDELQRKDWDNFAEGYNGKSYRENKYDTKLAAADAKLVSSWTKMFVLANDPGSAEVEVDMSDGSAEYKFSRADIAALQASINSTKLLLKPLKTDGWYGTNTAAALRVFQTKHKLEPTGLFDAATIAELHYDVTDLAA